MSIFLMRLLVPAILFFAAVSPAWAANPANEARQAWQLLDYIAVDYAGAVRNGQVVETGEYAEMQEFAETVSSKLAALPSHPEQKKLNAQAQQLKAKQVQQMRQLSKDDDSSSSSDSEFHCPF